MRLIILPASIVLRSVSTVFRCFATAAVADVLSDSVPASCIVFARCDLMHRRRRYPLVPKNSSCSAMETTGRILSQGH